MRLKEYPKDKLQKIVAKSCSLSDCLRRMGFGTSGSNPRNLQQIITEYGIDTSHFKPKTKKRKDKEIFMKDSGVSQATLRNRFRELTKEYICDVCGLNPVWNGKPLTLILDHKDGDNHNNVIENLHWVCPNCNSQLDTTGFHGMRKYDIYGNRLPTLDMSNSYNRSKIPCPRCGRLMTKTSKVCQVCSGKDRIKENKTFNTENIPLSRDELKDLIRTKSFSEIGRQFNLSDNGIRKWCTRFYLPTTKKEINKYSDDEWKKV